MFTSIPALGLVLQCLLPAFTQPLGGHGVGDLHSSWSGVDESILLA